LQVLLTIGYGDIAAKTAGGRVFFVVFVIAAVPIVTFSAIQTVSGLVRLSTVRTG
jgi:potassium channel subfamily K